MSINNSFSQEKLFLLGFFGIILSKVTGQILADVFIHCVNWKITLSFNLILQDLSITEVKDVIAQQWFQFTDNLKKGYCVQIEIIYAF